MIKNDVQYRVTKAQAAKFFKTLRELREKPPPRLARDAKLRKIYDAGIASQLGEMQEQLAEYEALRRGPSPSLELKSLDDLPKVLVQARIASGLSQRDLAGRLSVKEQQIQRYESTEYASASLSRVKEVALALGVRVTEPAVLKAAPRATAGRRTRRTNEAMATSPRQVAGKATVSATKKKSRATALKKAGAGSKGR
ncbi:MAG: helix-turn-helix transcriptional regulator [Acidobacteria bacterium]|nr:helix-turn-helix transcriptional regulator [Acidobacteriota bacterium]